MSMDKYAVDEGSDEELEKRAAGGCPKCGASPDSLTRDGAVVRCPRCGAEPFQSKK